MKSESVKIQGVPPPTLQMFPAIILIGLLVIIGLITTYFLGKKVRKEPNQASPLRVCQTMKPPQSEADRRIWDQLCSTNARERLEAFRF